MKSSSLFFQRKCFAFSWHRKSLIFLCIIFITVLFLISSCAKSQQNQQNIESDLEFKQLCQSAGYEWMLMKPTQDGKFIKDAEECWGCMVEGFEMVCDKEKFLEFIPPK